MSLTFVAKRPTHNVGATEMFRWQGCCTGLKHLSPVITVPGKILEYNAEPAMPNVSNECVAAGKYVFIIPFLPNKPIFIYDVVNCVTRLLLRTRSGKPDYCDSMIFCLYDLCDAEWIVWRNDRYLYLHIYLIFVTCMFCICKYNADTTWTISM